MNKTVGIMIEKSKSLSIGLIKEQIRKRRRKLLSQRTNKQINPKVEPKL